MNNKKISLFRTILSQKLFPLFFIQLWISIVTSMIFYSDVLAGKWIPIEPDGGERVILEIAGKEWEYYRLEPGEHMIFDVREKSKYRIITRVDFQNTRRRQVLYSFRLGWNETKLRFYGRAGIRASRKAHPVSSDNRVGKSKIIELSAPTNSFKLHIAMDDTVARSVYFRVQRLKDEFTSKSEYTSMSPVEYEKKKEIVTHENGSEYFLIDDSNMLKYTIIGPTTLKIYVRIAIHKDGSNRPKRPIDIYEDDEWVNTRILNFEISSISAFLNDTQFMPSIAETFYIEVPKGRHDYKFDLPEKIDKVYVRAFIPAKDLNPDS